ncbi:MAG: hypothetical protein ACTHJJ_09040 [Intrasporangium sp.]|uniref:hypothetical protein n=1 Tax=Intrasporangium sp. TaxID=1925024 RepID=UPI003F7E1CDD
MAGHPRTALAVALMVATTCGCTSGSPSGVKSGPSTVPQGAPAAGGAATTPSVLQAEAESTTGLSCEKPSEAVLDWAGVAIASHPGPIKASALVRAATTETGDWYVLALDREYERDDGTTTGEGDRNVALTNGVTGDPDDRKMIPLGRSEIGGVPSVSWDNVTWTGETLAAGKRAAERVVSCLDGGR